MESKIKRTIAIFLLVCLSVSVTAAASTNQWTKIGGPGKVFAADMNTIYGISPDGSGVYKYTGIPENWEKVGGPADQIYAGGAGISATNPDNGDIYQWK